MKNLLLNIIFCISAFAAAGQSVYEIVPEPTCWFISNQDSSLTRYLLVSSRTPGQISILGYVNAAGDVVDVSAGGFFTPGFCDCCNGSGSGSGDQDWLWPTTDKTNLNPIYHIGKVSVFTQDTTHGLRVDSDFQFNPEGLTTFDYQNLTDTTGTNYRGLLYRAPGTFSGSSNLSGGSNNFTIAKNAVPADRDRLGVYAFGGKVTGVPDIFESAWMEAFAEGAWTGINRASGINFYVTNGTTPYNIMTLEKGGRIELDVYNTFEDGVPTRLAGYNNTSRDITAHTIDGSSANGSLIGRDADGLVWVNPDSISGATNLTEGLGLTKDTTFSSTGTAAVTDRDFQYATPPTPSTSRHKSTAYTDPSGERVNIYDPGINNYSKARLDYTVATTNDLLTLRAPNGVQIEVRSTNARYYVQASAISGYTTDSVAVIPLLGGNFAVLQNEILYSKFFTGGIITDTSTHAGQAFQRMFNFAQIMNRSRIEISEGNYKIETALTITDTNLVVSGGKGKLFFNSKGTTTNRRIMNLINCMDINLSGLIVYGDTSRLLTQNQLALYFTDCKNIILEGIQLTGSYGLYAEARTGNTYDTEFIVRNCTIYNATGSMNPKSNTIIKDCYFSKDTTSFWDRVNNTYGSSHAIYIFAGNENITVSNCTFENIRTAGFKASGSALPIKNITVDNCRFIMCGTAVEVGADDNQYHENFLIQNNTFIDCGIIRSGWSGNANIEVLGSNNVKIIGNTIIYSRNRGSEVANSVRGIKVYQYATNSRPVSNVWIQNNSFILSPNDSVTLGPLVYGISVSDGNKKEGTFLDISNNFLGPICQSGFELLNNYTGNVYSNTIENVTVQFNVSGCSFLRVYENSFRTVSNGTNNAKAIFSNCPFLELHNNRLVGNSTYTNFKYQIDGVDDNLLLVNGQSGLIRPNGGLQEIILGYGSDWTNGDIVTVNGSSFVYGTDFSSMSDLISDINSLSGISATDYGAFNSNTTSYIRISYDTQTATEGQITLQTTTTNRTAGVYLTNAKTVGNSGKSISIGGSSSSNKAVIWTPINTNFSSIVLTGYDQSSQDFLNVAGYSMERDAYNNNACIIITFGLSATTTLKFNYQLL